MWLKKLFGIKEIDYSSLLSEGAYIIDVRTPREYSSGKIHNSQNIPLDKVKSKLKKMKQLNKPVIFCCASGMRSGQATSLAKASGIEAYNGGGWASLNRKLSYKYE